MNLPRGHGAGGNILHRRKSPVQGGREREREGGSLTSSVASNKDFWLLCLLYNANEWFAYFTALLVLSGSRSDLSFHSLVGNIIKPQSHFRSCAGIFSNYEIWENDHRDGKRDTHCSNQFFFFFFSFGEGQISHRAGTDEKEIAAEEEEKLGSKVYALSKSPSSVHSERDASLIIAILTLHTKDRIALNYICCTVHSRWTLKARWPRVWDRGRGPPTRPQQQDWVAGVLLGRLIGEFPLNKLHLICLETRAEICILRIDTLDPVTG